jgi:hypothetical protein
VYRKALEWKARMLGRTSPVRPAGISLALS